jgi:hypothetical protein
MRNFDLASVLVSANEVATGNDSIVYRYADTAVKEYSTASLEDVSLYVHTMTSCVSLIREIGYHFEVSILGDRYTVTFEGVPVDELTSSASQKPVTCSRYIWEPNLDWLTSRQEHFATYPAKPHSMAEWAFFQKLNLCFDSERPTRLRDNFEYHLCMLSRMLDYHLGTFGLYIGKYNVKPEPDHKRKHLTLLVTDVAVYLPRVVYSDNYHNAIETAESMAHLLDR